MALVDTSTGEIVDVMDAGKARYMTEEIKSDLSNIWSDIEELYAGRAWIALGYESWDDYCREEFGSSRIKLPSEERREVVSSLRDAGLSTRAIAAATGASKSTISRDLSGVPDGTPDRPSVEPNFKPGQVTGTDGKTYAKTSTRKSESVSTETPVGQDAIDAATERIAKSDVAYLERLSKAVVKVHALLELDPERCAAVSPANERPLDDQFIDMVRRWIDAYDQALRGPNLRSVK